MGHFLAIRNLTDLIFKNLDASIFRYMYLFLFCMFVLRFYVPVNSYGYVEPVSYPLTLFLGRLRPTTPLTST